VRTKAWEDALAFQSGWKRLGTSPRSARAGTGEASTADSVSRKITLLYYTSNQKCASVVNKIAGLLLKKNGPPRPSRVPRGGSLNSHLHAILAFREWPGDRQFHLHENLGKYPLQAAAHRDDLQDRIEWTPNALIRPLSAAPAEDRGCVSLGLFERNPVSSIQPFPRGHDPDFYVSRVQFVTCGQAFITIRQQRDSFGMRIGQTLSRLVTIIAEGKGCCFVYAAYCDVLRRIATYCDVLRRIATYCRVLPRGNAQKPRQVSHSCGHPLG
jgi:hypothetical protein